MRDSGGGGSQCERRSTVPRVKSILAALGTSATKSQTVERKESMIMFSNASPISTMLTECPKFWRGSTCIPLADSF